MSNHSNVLLPFALATLAACSAATTPPASTTPARAAPSSAEPAPTPTPQTASSPAVPPPREPTPDPASVLAAMEPEIHGLRDVVPWPMPDAPGLLLGRASSDSTDSLVWGVAGGAHGHVDLCCGHAGALLLLDVTGDARTEVVVAVEEPQDEGTRTRYLAYEYHDGSLRQLQRVAWMLEGLHGEAELRARAATLAGWPADPAAVSARELVLRMQSATPAQLRALLSPRGLRVCQSARGNLRPHFHRCHVLRGAALTDEALRRELPGDAGFADYETQDPPENSTFYAEPPQCTRRGNRETCSANIGGPAGTEWIFEGSGAARQLVEVGGWGTESS